MKKVGQGVLELLIGNENVTDRPTNMCIAICPLFCIKIHDWRKMGVLRLQWKKTHNIMEALNYGFFSQEPF